MSETRRLRTPDAAARACFNCQAWRGWGTQAVSVEGTSTIENQPVGQCRLRAPVAGQDIVHNDAAVWPVVSADDWCFEFRRDRK